MTKNGVKKIIKKKTIGQLKKNADDVFSIFIRIRDKGRCFTCGDVKEWKYQQAGHYVKREFNSTRYDERNVNCQCPQCNKFKGGNMDEYAMRLVRVHGKNVLGELNTLKHQTKRWRAWELEEIIEKYKAKIKEYQKEE